MGIQSFTDLRQWFFACVKGKGDGAIEAAPHWNLYGGDYGAKEMRITSNTRISDMDESYNFLENSIRAQNNPDGTRFRVQTFAPGKANNPTAETYIQIYERSAAPANQAAQTAGIAGLPVGVGSVEQLVQQHVQMERLKWENEDLKAQLNAPANGWERVLDTISGVPGIEKVLQALAVGVVSRFSPQAMPAVQAAMNGTPAAPTGEGDTDDDDPEKVFQNNIGAACQAIGTDPVTLSKKLKELITTNPEMARQLLQQ